MGFSFIHAADLHLDTPFSGLGRVDASMQQRMLDASLRALDRIVAKALEEEVAFVLFAGDLYDGLERGARAQLRLLKATEALSRAGIEVFIVHGNHDPVQEGWAAVQQWPTTVHFFPPRKVSARAVTRQGRVLATIHGISYGQRAETENLALRFPASPGPGFNIGLLHCQVGTNVGEYSPCSLQDLCARGLHYWALGHVHGHRVMHEQPWVVYPGNTQGRAFAPGEVGLKGAVLVRVEEEAVVQLEPFVTGDVLFEEVEARIDACPDLVALVRQLNEAAALKARRWPEGEWLFKADVRGCGPLADPLAGVQGHGLLLQALQEEAPPGLWWMGLSLDLRPAGGIEELRGGEDFKAALVESADAWRRGGEDLPEKLRRELQGCAFPMSQLEGCMEQAVYEVLRRVYAHAKEVE